MKINKKLKKKNRAMNPEAKAFFNQKMRISLLGESSTLSKTQVIDLCWKFFNYGVQFEKNQQG